MICIIQVKTTKKICTRLHVGFGVSLVSRSGPSQTRAVLTEVVELLLEQLRERIHVEVRRKEDAALLGRVGRAAGPQHLRM